MTMRRLTTKDGRAVAVRRLVQADRGKLQQFDRDLSDETRFLFPPHSYDDETVDEYIRRNERGDDIIYVAEHEDKIVAYFFLWYASRPTCLLGIGIADEFQGVGLGRQLMEILIESGREAGCEAIELTTAPENERAFVLYQKCGFQYLGDVENQMGEGKVRVERCMFLPLKPGAKPMEEPHAPPVG